MTQRWIVDEAWGRHPRRVQYTIPRYRHVLVGVMRAEASMLAAAGTPRVILSGHHTQLGARLELNARSEVPADYRYEWVIVRRALVAETVQGLLLYERTEQARMRPWS